MLCKPERSKTISTTGEQSEDYMHKGDPVGEVQPKRKQRTTGLLFCCWAYDHSRSPVAVQSLHLLLDVTADAVAMVSVHPLSHHSNADLMFMFAKYKALYF